MIAQTYSAKNSSKIISVLFCILLILMSPTVSEWAIEIIQFIEEDNGIQISSRVVYLTGLVAAIMSVVLGVLLNLWIFRMRLTIGPGYIEYRGLKTYCFLDSEITGWDIASDIYQQELIVLTDKTNQVLSFGLHEFVGATSIVRELEKRFGPLS